MEAYQQAHKARLTHVKTCPTLQQAKLMKWSDGRLARPAVALAHHQHFANRIARQKKLNRSEIPE